MRLAAFLWVSVLAPALAIADEAGAGEELLGLLKEGHLVFSTDLDHGGTDRFRIWFSVEGDDGGQKIEWWLHGEGQDSAMVQLLGQPALPVYCAAGAYASIVSKTLPGMMETALGVTSRIGIGESSLDFEYLTIGKKAPNVVRIEIDILESKVVDLIERGAPVYRKTFGGREFFWVYTSPEGRFGLQMGQGDGGITVELLMFEELEGSRYWFWFGEPEGERGEVSPALLREAELMSRTHNMFRWRAGKGELDTEEGLERLVRPQRAIEAAMRGDLNVGAASRLMGLLEERGWRIHPNLSGREVLLREPWVESEKGDAVWRGLRKGMLTFPEGVDDLVLPFEWWSGTPVARLAINGEEVGKVIVDTGAEMTIVSEAVGEKIGGGWSRNPSARAFGMGGNRKFETRKIDSLSVGGIATDLKEVAVTDLSDGLGVDGFVGRDLLATVPFTLDPVTREIVFHRPESFSPPEEAVKVEVREDDDEPPRIEIEFGEGDPLLCMPDTGFSNGLSMKAPTFSTRMGEERIDRWVFGTTRGPFGKETVRVARLDEEGNRRVGMFGEPVSGLAIDIKKAGEGSDDRSGVIGMEILSRYRVTYDYRGGAIYVDGLEVGEIAGSEELSDRVKRGDVAEVERLLAEGEMPGLEALVRAAESGQVDLLRRFDEMVPGLVDDRRNLMESAIRRGDLAMSKYLADWGVELQGEQRGFSLLGPAIYGEQPELVGWLLERGVKPTGLDLGLVFLRACGETTTELLLNAASEELLDGYVPEGLFEEVDNLPWLSLAARNKSHAGLRFFVRRGDDLNRRDGAGMTALLGAVAAGNREGVEFLLESGADGTFFADGKGGILTAGVHCDDDTMLEWLLGLEGLQEMVVEKDVERAVRAAVLKGKVDAVKLLAGAVVDLTGEGEAGKEALHLASALLFRSVAAGIDGPTEKAVGQENFAELVLYLIEQGVPVEGKLEGVGLMLFECLACDPRMVGVLKNVLDGESPPGAEVIDRALVVAAGGGAEPVAELLLARGANVQKGDVVEKGKDAIYDALVGGHVGVLEMLLAEGANARARMAGAGRQPLLHVAAGAGDPYGVRALVASGADVGGRDADDGTALMWAVQARSREAVLALIELGADLGAKDWLGKDAAEYARRLEPEEAWLVELLEAAETK